MKSERYTRGGGAETSTRSGERKEPDRESAPMAQFSNIKSSLTAIVAERKELVVQRDTLGHQLTTAKTSTTPETGTPVDVLIETFAIHVLQHRESPWSVTGVCRRWRLAALSAGLCGVAYILRRISKREHLAGDYMERTARSFCSSY